MSMAHDDGRTSARGAGRLYFSEVMAVHRVGGNGLEWMFFLKTLDILLASYAKNDYLRQRNLKDISP